MKTQIDSGAASYMVDAAEYLTELRLKFEVACTEMHRGELDQFRIRAVKTPLNKLKRALEMVDFCFENAL